MWSLRKWESMKRKESFMKNESQLKSSKRGVLLRLAIFMALMISAFLIPSSALADFGYTEDSTNYTIDTGANLVFKVKRSNGDISSLIYNGTDYNGYTNKNSHVETGLGQSDVTISQPSSSVIMVKVVYGTLEQYYVARKGENNIYMFTYIADDSVTVTRYIVRLKPSLFPVLNTSNSWYSSYSTLEAKDIFTDTSTGYTYSKHYSDTRVMDYNYTGISNGNVGAYIVRSNHEKASGGPFYRSLIRDNTDVAVNLYEILYYGMAQTEALRLARSLCTCIH
jgi:rhamnogalacturonan endolyase